MSAASSKVKNQTLDVDINLDHCELYGKTTIEVEQDAGSRQIFLCSQQISIHDVVVGNKKARFEYVASMNKISPDEKVRDLLNFRICLARSSASSDLGDLRISLPDNCHFETNDKDGVIFATWRVVISFSLRNPRSGLVFAGSGVPGAPPRHCYTDGQWAGTRQWFPCNDSLAGSSPFELNVTVAKGNVVVTSLPPAADRQDLPDGRQRWSFASVACDQPYQLPARAVGLAVGPFLKLGDPGSPGRLTHYCLPFPQAEADVAFSTQFLSRALEFLERPLGKLPWNGGSLSHVFVEHPPEDAVSYPGLILADAGLLHDASSVLQASATARSLVCALAAQWLGLNGLLRPWDWADAWLVQGLAGHMAALCLRRLEGHNAYLYRLWSDMADVASADLPTSPPLCLRGADGGGGVLMHPVEILSSVRAKKAALVVRLVEKRLGEAAFHKVLSSLMRSGGGGGGVGGGLSLTEKLFRQSHKTSGVDLKSLVQPWVFGSGAAEIRANYEMHPKKIQFAVEVKDDEGRRVPRDIVVRVHETEVMLLSLSPTDDSNLPLLAP